MIFVDAFDFSNACTVWYTYPHQDKDIGKELMQFLGVHHYHACKNGFTMSPEAAHKLRLLLSPYATTIIKVYYARQSS